jgi:site-specific recombinase XerD
MLAEKDVAAFLSYLASDLGVAASTQNQALNALIFLYQHVLERPMSDLGKIVRSRHPALLPVVLTTLEVTALLRQMEKHTVQRAIVCALMVTNIYF